MRRSVSAVNLSTASSTPLPLSRMHSVTLRAVRDGDGRQVNRNWTAAAAAAATAAAVYECD